VISGTPTLAGTYNVLLSAANGGGTGTRSLSLVIQPAGVSAPVITSPATASVVVGNAFSYRITANNSPTSFNATGLPSDLTVNTSNGQISGTPTLARQYDVVLSAANAAGTNYLTLLLTVLGESSFGPANDRFANRSQLTGTNVSVNGGNNNATAETGEPTHAGYEASKSVWWTWTAPSAGTVTLATVGSSFDTLLAVYTGTNVDALAGVASDDQGGGNNASLLQFTATAGQAYQFAVDGYFGDAGNIVLNLSLAGGPNAPANDNFASRITLSGATVSTTGRNTDATPQGSEPSHAGYAATRSVWWTWTAPSSGTVTLDTVGSDFDTLLAVYTGSALGSLAGVASDDQGGGGNTSLLTFAAVSGTTYQIAVDGYSGAAGNIVLNLQLAGAVNVPVNDPFAGRITLAGTSVATTGTNVNATAESGEPLHAGVGATRSVWWTWTAPGSGVVQLHTEGSGFDTLLAVYTGTAVGGLSLVTANDDHTNLLTSLVSFTASSGTVYQIAVDGFDGASGTVALNLQLQTAAPANDSFASATVLTGTNLLAGGANVNATPQASEPDHNGYTPAKSVWWRWTAPRAGRVSLTTANSSFDTVLAVYTGSAIATLTNLISNDDYVGTLTSTVSFYAVSNTTYQIAVDGYAGASGSIQLSLVQAPDDGYLYQTDFESFPSYLAGFDGWLGEDTANGNAGIITAFTGQGLAAYLGYFPPAGAYAGVWRPIQYDPVGQGTPVIQFSVDMAVVDSSTTDYDLFTWAVYNRDGLLLARLVFDNSSLAIYYQNGSPTLFDTTKDFRNDTKQQLNVIINFQANTWSASLDGVALFQSITFNTAGTDRDLGDVTAEWFILNETAGDNFLLFDNYAVRAYTSLAAPSVTTHPQSQVVEAGGLVNLSVGVAGTAPFTYQWQLNSNNIAGATNSVLALSGVASNQSGFYRVTVGNLAGSVTSSNAVLTVTNRLATAVLGSPTLTSRGLQFEVTGTPGRTYRLEMSTDLKAWEEISTLVNQTGTLLFLDPGALGASRRFYRLKEL
jgi:hypothetical protein